MGTVVFVIALAIFVSGSAALLQAGIDWNPPTCAKHGIPMTSLAGNNPFMLMDMNNGFSPMMMPVNYWLCARCENEEMFARK